MSSAPGCDVKDPDFWAKESMYYESDCPISPRKAVYSLLTLDAVLWSVILVVGCVQTARLLRASANKYGRTRSVYAIHVLTVICAATRLLTVVLRLRCNLECASFVHHPLQRVLFALPAIAFLPSVYLFLLSLVRVLAAAQMRSDRRAQLERRALVVCVIYCVALAVVLCTLLLLPLAPHLEHLSLALVNASNSFLAGTIWLAAAAFLVYGFTLAREIESVDASSGNSSARPSHAAASSGSAASVASTRAVARNIRLVSLLFAALGLTNGALDLVSVFIGPREIIWAFQYPTAALCSAVMLYTLRAAAHSHAVHPTHAGTGAGAAGKSIEGGGAAMGNTPATASVPLSRRGGGAGGNGLESARGRPAEAAVLGTTGDHPSQSTARGGGAASARGTPKLAPAASSGQGAGAGGNSHRSARGAGGAELSVPSAALTVGASGGAAAAAPESPALPAHGEVRLSVSAPGLPSASAAAEATLV